MKDSENKLDRLREGNIPSPNKATKNIMLWAGGAVLGCLAIVGYTAYLINAQSAKNSLPDDTDFRETHPTDFFAGSVIKSRNEPRYVSNFPTNQEEYTSPPKTEVVNELDAQSAFNNTTSNNSPAVINEDSNRRRQAIMYRYSNAVGGFTTAEKTNVIDSQSSPMNPNSEPLQTVKTHDDDFGADVEKDVSSLPVDLTRTITADRAIPCILRDQIHSQIAGQVSCQVENNVFGFHGRKILVPAGSSVIGFYEPIEKTGMSRFSLQWKRLIRPDGVHIALTDAYASDQIGQAGVTGEVDNRFFDKYGAAIITASLSTLAQVSMTARVEQNSTSQAVYENFGTDLGKVTASMLEEVVNIKPFAVVPSGTRLFIRPQTDIWLRQTSDNRLVFGVTDSKEDSL